MRFISTRARKSGDGVSTQLHAGSDRSTLQLEPLTKSQIKRATRTRKIACIVTSLLLFISLVFIIMVEIGNTRNRPVLRNIYFIQLNLSNVVPVSVPNSSLLNSIAQTIGLFEFYQVGLWNYCEGNFSTGISDCSKAKTSFWFNPVEIIVSELIAGAVLTLPSEITQILNILRIVSKVMAALFLTSAVLTFILILIVLASVYSRWITLGIMLITLLNAIFVTAASVIATAVFIIIRNTFQSTTEVNIGATIGINMFALMWTASACSLFAAGIQLALSCCCASRRDVRTGRKRGSRKAYEVTKDPL